MTPKFIYINGELATSDIRSGSGLPDTYQSGAIGYCGINGANDYHSIGGSTVYPEDIGSTISAPANIGINASTGSKENTDSSRAKESKKLRTKGSITPTAGIDTLNIIGFGNDSLGISTQSGRQSANKLDSGIDIQSGTRTVNKSGEDRRYDADARADVKGFDLMSALRGNYIYASVNTTNHIPLYLERHLQYAAESYLALYGTKPKLNTAKISDSITRLLGHNSLPKSGNIVNIYLIPQCGASHSTPDIVITHDRQTLYKGYSLISIRPKAAIANYEIPFESHRTSVSLTTATFMDTFAAKSGAHIALRATRSGKLVSSGDFPVFAVKDRQITTPGIGHGTGNSVERDLMFRACGLAGIEITESDIEVDSLCDLDEIIVFNTSGIQSVLQCGQCYYYNIVAMKLEKVLEELTKEGLGK